MWPRPSLLRRLPRQAHHLRAPRAPAATLPPLRRVPQRARAVGRELGAPRHDRRGGAQRARHRGEALRLARPPHRQRAGRAPAPPPVQGARLQGESAAAARRRHRQDVRHLQLHRRVQRVPSRVLLRVYGRAAPGPLVRGDRRRDGGLVRLPALRRRRRERRRHGGDGLDALLAAASDGAAAGIEGVLREKLQALPQVQPRCREALRLRCHGLRPRLPRCVRSPLTALH